MGYGTVVTSGRGHRMGRITCPPTLNREHGVDLCDPACAMNRLNAAHTIIDNPR